MERETGKRRSLRIPLDYYKQPGFLLVLKRCMGGAAAALAIAWGAYMLGCNRMPASRGPLAAVHAAWDTQCQACHDDRFFTLSPTSDQNWTLAALGASHQEVNEKCQACHQAPTHHKGLTDRSNKEYVEDCASCHHDHQGRQFSLVRLPDSACTSCHASKSLDAHLHKAHQGGFHAPITAFSKDGHSELKIHARDGSRIFVNEAWGKSATKDSTGIEGKDPGRLKFNHKLHMTAGLESQFKFSQIEPAALQEQYWKFQRPAIDSPVDLAALVQLKCETCHQSDGANPFTGNPTRTSADLMLQPNYETHCRACHPLTFDAKLPDVHVPHGIQPAEVREFIWGALAKASVAPLRDPNDKSTLRMPGPKSVEDVEKTVADDVNSKVIPLNRFLFLDQVEKRERYLYSGRTSCGECHTFEADPIEPTQKKVVPTRVPTVWFPHATFNHAAHRGIECRACHERAYADSSNASIASSDVLIPGIDNCVKCHAAPTRSFASPIRFFQSEVAQARHDCTGCHRYHNGDHALAGIGASERAAGAPRDISSFLKGNLPPKAKKEVVR